MGLEVALLGLSALVGAVGGIAQAGAARNAAGAEKEARAVQGAQNRYEAIQSRRERVREMRIRRAQIMAGAENQGTSGSSGAAGAASALTTNFAGLVGTSRSASTAAEGVNDNLQRAADFTSQANTIGAWTNTIQSGLKGFSTIFDGEE